MIPLKDDNPTKKKSVIRLILVIICSIVFLIQITSVNNNELIFYFGFKPNSIFNSTYQVKTFTPLLTIFTSMFMHGGWLHFLGNMLYLWIFADNIEDKVGRKKFILFYLLSGIAAALTQYLGDTQSSIPMIGASGAIAGVLGAYIYFFPRAKVLVIIPLLIFFFTARLPSIIVLGFWFFIQFINLTFLSNSSSNVAWLAHIGGFLFGLIYAFLFKEKTRKKGKSKLIKKRKGDDNPWNN
tara:strand:- start:957 stop:1673 length:717 start_codon:yes stop_codon:yes gene_type:complete